MKKTNDRRSGLCKRTVWASKEKQWKIAFLGWENPNNENIMFYHVDYYAMEAKVDYPGRYKTEKEAREAAKKMIIPDVLGVYPELTVEPIKNDE